MKKVVTVRLASEIFQMEEDGYLKIQKVLKKIEAVSTNAVSIIKDIEVKMASILKEKATSENLVTSEQIEGVLQGMGYAGYLNEETSSPYTHNPFRSGYKRLYRHPSEKILGGVCGGVAAYLNTDPVFIRILFVVLFFGFGTGLFLYLIMWIVVPQAHTLDEIYNQNQ
jgi:phage shock protein C